MSTVCPNCGNSYEHLGKHWTGCGYPELSERQKQILVGGLMGDATVGQRGIENKNPRWTLTNTNPDYARFVHGELQPFSRIRGPIEPGENNVRPRYEVRVVHPWVENLAGWYETGEKVFPEVELTPTILKHWYACDGHKQLTHNAIRFHLNVHNERNNPDKLVSMFDDIGLDVRVSNNDLYGLNNDKSFYEYMGEPPDGMKYKWPNQSL